MHTYAIAIVDWQGWCRGYVPTVGHHTRLARKARKFSTAADATLFVEDHPEMQPVGGVPQVVGLLDGWEQRPPEGTLVAPPHAEPDTAIAPGRFAVQAWTNGEWRFVGQPDYLRTRDTGQARRFDTVSQARNFAHTFDRWRIAEVDKLLIAEPTNGAAHR